MERKWWLVIAGCTTHAVNTGFSYFGMSAFFPSLKRKILADNARHFYRLQE
jgi:hypothetical protein